jgi:hypothetical protein
VKGTAAYASSISVGEHMTSNSNAGLGQDSQKFDLDWLGDDAIVRTALVVFKLPETQGGKSDFVKFLTPITTKRVSLKK